MSWRMSESSVLPNDLELNALQGLSVPASTEPWDVLGIESRTLDYLLSARFLFRIHAAKELKVSVLNGRHGSQLQRAAVVACTVAWEHRSEPGSRLDITEVPASAAASSCDPRALPKLSARVLTRLLMVPVLQVKRRWVALTVKHDARCSHRAARLL